MIHQKTKFRNLIKEKVSFCYKEMHDTKKSWIKASQTRANLDIINKSSRREKKTVVIFLSGQSNSFWKNKIFVETDNECRNTFNRGAATMVKRVNKTQLECTVRISFYLQFDSPVLLSDFCMFFHFVLAEDSTMSICFQHSLFFVLILLKMLWMHWWWW